MKCVGPNNANPVFFIDIRIVSDSQVHGCVENRKIYLRITTIYIKLFIHDYHCPPFTLSYDNFHHIYNNILFRYGYTLKIT